MENHWNERELRKSFDSTALESDRYFKEVLQKVVNRTNYESVADDALAKFYVYDRIARRAWSTPSELAEEARKLKEIAPRDSQSFDQERLQRCYRAWLDSLIVRYDVAEK